MKDNFGLYGFFVYSCIHLNLYQASAVNKPTLPFDVQSSGADSLNPPEVDSSLSNVTSFVAVDPAFGFVPIFSGEKLPPVPCLLISVNAALQLALEDFEGFIFETRFKLDSHPQVEIAVIPDEAGGCIPRKYAVWGLNFGINLMTKNRNYQTATFILSYRGQGIACITYRMTGFHAPLRTGISNATQSVNQALPRFNATTSQAFADANTTHLDTTDAIPNPLLRVAFQLTGSVITIYDIFFLAMDMLRDLAPYSRKTRLTDGTTYIEAAKLDVSTRQSNPPRTAQNPPYFQVEWLMRAIAQTPAYMLEHRSFKEVDMVLFVNEIMVGEVSVKRPSTRNGLTQASGDASTS